MCFLYTHSSFAIQGKVWLKSLNIMDLKVLRRKFIKSKNNEIALFIIKIALSLPWELDLQVCSFLLAVIVTGELHPSTS